MQIAKPAAEEVRSRFGRRGSSVRQVRAEEGGCRWREAEQQGDANDSALERVDGEVRGYRWGITRAMKGFGRTPGLVNRL